MKSVLASLMVLAGGCGCEPSDVVQDAGAAADADGDAEPSPCQLRPSELPVVTPGEPDDWRAELVGAVQSWQYFLDVDITGEQIDEIEASSHELLVIDFIPSEENNTDFDMEGLVDRMHEAAVPKLVVAYVDIGQAESFRAYFHDEEWGVGDPDSPWIVAEDPDGWEENYPVAYWDPEWQTIWLGEDGLVAQIADAGMDGIYLDWVEAYSNDDVIDAADEAGVDPVDEMISWAGLLAEAGRSRNPDFLVIGQNAAELAAASSEYRDVIDGLAQEQTWFDGAADGVPQGDCQLPATDDDIEAEAYVSCLSEPCRALHDEYPDSTLHVSTQSYIRDLDAVLEAGTPVLTVDYALEPSNVRFVGQEARRRGYVPFVGPRWHDEVVSAP